MGYLPSWYKSFHHSFSSPFVPSPWNRGLSLGTEVPLVLSLVLNLFPFFLFLPFPAFTFSQSLNLYCWKGLHFSWNNFLIFLHLFFIVFFSFHHWFRDLLRELGKKYEVLLIIFFLVFLLFLASEALLFISFFWASFHSLSSPTLGIWPGEGFYLPDPCELTFANTLLLSN